jgi:hypothetical protein
MMRRPIHSVKRLYVGKGAFRECAVATEKGRQLPQWKCAQTTKDATDITVMAINATCNRHGRSKIRSDQSNIAR